MNDHYFENINGDTGRTLFNRKGIYYSGRPGAFKRLNPQPKPEEIIHFLTVNFTHQVDPNYKKRFTMVCNGDSSLDSIRKLALIEYSGQRKGPARLSHGNAKEVYKNRELKTSTKTMEKARELLQGIEPRQAYDKLIQQEEYEDIRNVKQLRNLKHRMKPKLGSEMNLKRSNLADQYTAVLNKRYDKNNKFIQDVRAPRPDQPPLVIAFHEEHFMAIIGMCKKSSKNKCIIHIDKTFGLGKYFITTMTYQNMNVRNKIDGTHPVMLGAVFLHYTSTMDDFQCFFDAIQKKLDKFDVDVVVGSDREPALVQGAKKSFPKSSIIHCTRHIRENIERHCSNNIGMTLKERTDIAREILGTKAVDGLFSKIDRKTFESQIEDLKKKYEANGEKTQMFLKYFEEHIEETARNHNEVINAHPQVSPKWTNNIAECVNFVIKKKTNWTFQTVNEILNKMEEISKNQISDLKRAILGTGDYRLCKHVKNLERSHSRWHAMSDDAKTKHFKRFLNANLPIETPFITSTDGSLTIPPSTAHGKKPGQKHRWRKRSKANHESINSIHLEKEDAEEVNNENVLEPIPEECEAEEIEEEEALQEKSLETIPNEEDDRQHQIELGMRMVGMTPTKSLVQVRSYLKKKIYIYI